MSRDGKPIVVWGERKPTVEDGRFVYCPRLHVAVPGVSHEVVHALPAETGSAFLHPELAGAGKHLHLAFDVEGRLVYQRSGLAPQELSVKSVERIRIDATGKKVLVGAKSSDGRLTVYEKVGSKDFRILVRAKKVHEFDLVYAGGKPVVAWSGRTIRRLTVVTAGHRIPTRTPAEKVALGAQGKVAHVVFSTAAHLDCSTQGKDAGCLRAGVYHVGLKGRRIVHGTTQVQSGAASPYRIAVASHGRTVGVAMSRNGVTTLHQRRF